VSLMTFPFSPLPAGTSRMKDWNSAVQEYDSGDSQGLSPWIKPLYRYSLPLNNYTEIKQSSLWHFWDLVKGATIPFLLRDPYDYSINSVLAVRSGITNAATLFFYDVNSYMVRPDTVFTGSLFSALSGYVRLGIEYGLDQDSGILTVNTKAVTDVWGVRSMFYLKKCRFSGDHNETSPLWNVFNSNLSVKEMP
jgi:hypothetical protein